MNKVFCDGWIYNIIIEENEKGIVEAKFSMKTRKIVGMKERDKAEYYYIPCEARGKKAINIRDNGSNGTKAYIWARIFLADDDRLKLAVDEIEFYN